MVRKPEIYHAVMVDETGCEFGADWEAFDKAQAYRDLQEAYPESRIVQLESPADTAYREGQTYKRVQQEIDGYLWSDEDDSDYLADNCLN